MFHYHCNVSFGDMLHWIHGIVALDARHMVIFACPHTNRMVCENGGNCYTGTGNDDGYLIIFRSVHASR